MIRRSVNVAPTGETMSGGSEESGQVAGWTAGRAPFRGRREERSFLYLIWAGIAVAALGFLVVTTWISLQSRSRTVEAAIASIENLSLVLEKLMARKIDAIEGLLQTALHEAQSGGDAPQHTTSLLAELARDLPYVRTVKLINVADGATVLNLQDTGEAGDGIDLEVDRAYRENPNLDLYVSRPRRDGASRQWLTGISRHGPPGTSTAGLIAVAHIDIEQVQHLFDEINIGQYGSIALWRSDGMLLLRKPYVISNVGRQLPSAALFDALAGSPAGHFETVSVADGVRRLVSYRALPGTSLIISTTLSVEEVLAPWRQDVLRNISLVAAAIFSLVVFEF